MAPAWHPTLSDFHPSGRRLARDWIREGEAITDRWREDEIVVQLRQVLEQVRRVRRERNEIRRVRAGAHRPTPTGWPWGDWVEAEILVERILREQEVDGHQVAVVEVVEEEGPAFLLVADEVVINSGAPLPVAPTDKDVREIYRRWRRG